MDLLRLRLLSVVATSCLVLYFAGQPEPLLNVVAWNLFFVGLNLVQLVRLLRARRRRGASVRLPTMSAGLGREPDGRAGSIVAKEARDGPARPPFEAAGAIASFAWGPGDLRSHHARLEAACAAEEATLAADAAASRPLRPSMRPIADAA